MFNILDISILGGASAPAEGIPVPDAIQSDRHPMLISWHAL